MPGYTAPIVKLETGEAEEEAADYGAAEDDPTAGGSGGGGRAEAPLRAMPDYGDLLEDDEPTFVQPGGAGSAAKEPKDEDGPQGNAEPRKEAIHVEGVQRLTRTHIAEIFSSKALPLFSWVEWLDDNRVLCVFAGAGDAAAALRGFEEGFHNTGADESRPGPGLWRAQRGMLDVRASTQADRPAADYRRQHRGGRQVREFRFWEAMKDMDKSILGDGEETRGTKRSALPSGEDAIAAADWDDDAQRRKRLRRGIRPGDDEDGAEMDLLNAMAAQDKAILTKEEAGESASLPKTNEAALADVKLEGEGGGRWQNSSGEDWWSAADGRWRGKGGGDRDRDYEEEELAGGQRGEQRGSPKQQDDGRGGDSWSQNRQQAWWERGGGGASWEAQADWSQNSSWSSRGRKRGGGQGGEQQQQRRQSSAAHDDGAPPSTIEQPQGADSNFNNVPMDEEERARRSRRADRFRVPGASSAGGEGDDAQAAATAATAPKQEA